jgi:GPH family glycoside/pentoside/hexuronide:cation symporter
VAYAAPAVILAALGLSFYVYLPKFYADTVGIDLTVLGIVVLASRMWDAVTDPAIGALSDRTRSRWGRRRPWMALAAVPLAGSFYLLLTPPVEMGTSAVMRFALLAFVFFLCWTMVVVPYESLGAEISFDYDDRNRLFGAREAAVLLGTLVGSALPALFDPSQTGAVRGYGLLGLVYAAAAAVLIGWCVTFVHERRWAAAQRPHGSPWSNLKPLFKNRPFLVLLVAYTAWSLGGAIAATVILFYVQYVLQSNLGPLFLVLYLGLGALFLPLWVRLAQRWEKKPAWLLALSMNTLAFSGVALLGEGDTLAFGILVSLSAIGLGGALAIPPSMQADVIDYDQWQSATRREGQYVGMWALAKKLAMAVGAAIAFPLLDWAGYVGGLDVQPPAAVVTLKVLYVGGPLTCNLLAIAVGLLYPITRAFHERIRAHIVIQKETV